MLPYCPSFRVGSEVRIKDSAVLQEFLQNWAYHNPLSANQLAHAGKAARIAKVGFYHGGDSLYELEGIPGVWHEVCLKGVPG